MTITITEITNGYIVNFNCKPKYYKTTEEVVKEVEAILNRNPK